jgi:hypothetical protein
MFEWCVGRLGPDVQQVRIDIYIHRHSPKNVDDPHPHFPMPARAHTRVRVAITSNDRACAHGIYGPAYRNVRVRIYSAQNFPKLGAPCPSPIQCLSDLCLAELLHLLGGARLRRDLYCAAPAPPPPPLPSRCTS